jgi:hypothetical protein
MNWRFTLIDRDNVTTLIEEPQGWDACDIIIKRDLDKHGIVFDYAGNDFTFYGASMKMIQTEYEAYGVQGKLTMVIELDCGEQGYKELYRGQLLFGQYKFTCGDACFVKIPIETTSDVMAFTNRFDQQVNLMTDKGFDEVTALMPYNKLGFDIVLPSKGIYIEDYALNEIANGTTIEGVVGLSSGTSKAEYGMISIGMTKTAVAEIGSFYFEPQPKYDYAADLDGEINNGSQDAIRFETPPGNAWGVSYIWPNALTAIINYGPESPNYNEVNDFVHIEYRIKGKLTCRVSALDNVKMFFCRLPISKTGELKEDFEYLDIQDLFFSLNYWVDSMHDGDELPFDLSFATDLKMVAGDRFYLFISTLHNRTIDESNSDEPAMEVVFDVETYFKASTISITPSSLSKAFLVNETLSRITEAITDDKMRVYSDYFGRTDSQPYVSSADGCGSLEIISKGLFIRKQENRIPDEPFLMTVSMKDMWEGLDPIHHIGFGVEEDDMHAGFKRIRVEHWKYFYSDDVLMNCDAVNQVERKCQESEIYATFKFGYEKWEAEEYNGLDEFLTKRTYRTTLSEVKNNFERISKFIASGYAWEITRRKYFDSKDWRFDNDNFIACIKRFNRSYSYTLFAPVIKSSHMTVVGSFPDMQVGDFVIISDTASNNGPNVIADIIGSNIYFTTLLVHESAGSVTITLAEQDFVIEQGNVDSPVNIISPETLYNFRLSPLRNAMRWLDKVIASYKKLNPANKLVFTEGDGNYLAEGKMQDATCRLEVVPIKENMPLESALYEDASNMEPLLSAERIEFEYPMSLNDFRAILLNPYGLILFNSGTCEDSEGWIDTLSYKPEEGKAKFILIPKYAEASEPPEPPPANVFLHYAETDDEQGTVHVDLDGTPIINNTNPIPALGFFAPVGSSVHVIVSLEAGFETGFTHMIVKKDGVNIYAADYEGNTIANEFSFVVEEGAFYEIFSEVYPATAGCESIMMGTYGPMPDAFYEIPYSYSIPIISGTPPFLVSVYSKAPWMTIEIIGSDLVFHGTPDNPSSSFVIFGNVTNCDGVGAFGFYDNIAVTIAGAECVGVTGPTEVLDTMPDAHYGVYYNHSITLGGTGLFVVEYVNKPPWMNLTIYATEGAEGGTLTLSGTPPAVWTDNIMIQFTLSNCDGGSSYEFYDEINIRP